MTLVKKWFGETTKYQKKMKSLVEELSPNQELYVHSGRLSSRFRNDDGLYVLAWVHDLVEDGYGTLEEISKRFRLSHEQEKALDALTRRECEEYFQYIKRVQENPLATVVKLVDLEDNICRCCNNIKDHWQLLMRYAKAYGILTGEQK